MKKQIPLLQITSKIGSGATPHGGSNVYLKKGISFIRSQNVQDMHFSENGLVFLNQEQAKNLNGVSVKSGDILLNITGDSIARSCIVPDEILPARVNQHVAIIRCKNKQDAEYIGYYIQYLKPHLLQICKVGGTRNALTKDVISKLNVHLLDDRCKRATILTSINKKIELNNRINAELEAMAKTLYDYWFVQFDFPDEKGRPYKSSGGKMVYNKVLKRKIPEGWGVNSLDDWIQMERGVTYAKKDICEIKSKGASGILRATNVTGNIIDIDDMVYISKEKIQSRQKLHKYDTLMVMSSGSKEHVGKNGLFYFDVPQCFGAFCSKIASKNNNYHFFITLILQSSSFKSYIKSQCLGTNINNLTNELIYRYNVVQPDSKILQKFEKSVQKFYEQTALNFQENQKLTELRDWLLPMLMNGQVKVG
ncbi:MAG: hypothetical protein AUK31_02160 [Fibrobacteres bacterium CG2_30_45_31]|nr:MAG: hypothetical protein AUK31_02160 [Fibrobacteres bacterium CG2_30_45_31]